MKFSKFNLLLAMLGLLALLTAPSTLRAQATYAQTVEYLTHHVAAGPYKNNLRSWVTFPSRCVMQYHHRLIFRDGQGSLIRRTVNISDLSSSSVGVDTAPGRTYERHGTISASTFRQQRSIVTHHYRGPNIGRYVRGANLDQLGLRRFSDDTWLLQMSVGHNREGVVRAMRHLIELCGGRSEPRFN